MISKLFTASVCAAVAILGQANAQETKEYAYPETPTCDQVDEYFGVKVADPYRWMETEKTPELIKWTISREFRSGKNFARR